MSQRNKSRIPVRPHTVSGGKEEDENSKKELEVQFTSQSMIESVTDLNDTFATGDTPKMPEILAVHPLPEEKEKKIPLFKQSLINCSIIDSGVNKWSVPQKKYVPNYKKELTIKPIPDIKKNAPKKRISIPDELKSFEEPFPECGLAEQITQEIQKQLEELKQDSDTTNDVPTPLLTDSHRIQEIETRLSDLEQKLESLIELLYESQIIKGPELKIKLEEYNLEKLNTSLRLHKIDSKSKNQQTKIIPENSDPSVFKQIYYETREKNINLETQEKSEESLNLNKLSTLKKSGWKIFEPRQYTNMLKPIGKFSVKNNTKN